MEEHFAKLEYYLYNLNENESIKKSPAFTRPYGLDCTLCQSEAYFSRT